MPSTKPMIVFALLLITVGIGWLLNTMQVIEGVDIIWPAILAVLGVLTLGLAGLDKFTFVVGPMLILSAVFLILDQTEKLPPRYSLPSLVIALGVLILFATITPIRTPKWMTEDDNNPLPPGQ